MTYVLSSILTPPPTIPHVFAQKEHKRQRLCLCVRVTLGSSRPPGYDLCLGQVVGHLSLNHGHPLCATCPPVSKGGLILVSSSSKQDYEWLQNTAAKLG